MSFRALQGRPRRGHRSLAGHLGAPAARLRVVTGAGPRSIVSQDGLAEAAAVGAGVWESFRSTFIRAVSAPRIAAFSLLPSLGMAKATMES